MHLDAFLGLIPLDIKPKSSIKKIKSREAYLSTISVVYIIQITDRGCMGSQIAVYQSNVV